MFPSLMDASDYHKFKKREQNHMMVAMNSKPVASAFNGIKVEQAK